MLFHPYKLTATDSEINSANKFLDTLLYDRVEGVIKCYHFQGGEFYRAYAATNIVRKCLGRTASYDDLALFVNLLSTASFVEKGLARKVFFEKFISDTELCKISVSVTFDLPKNYKHSDLLEASTSYSAICKNYFSGNQLYALCTDSQITFQFDHNFYANIVNYSGFVLPEFVGSYDSFYRGGAYPHFLTKFAFGLFRSRLNCFLGYLALFHAPLNLQIDSMERMQLILNGGATSTYTHKRLLRSESTSPYLGDIDSYVPSRIQSTFLGDPSVSQFFESFKSISYHQSTWSYEHSFLESWFLIEKQFGATSLISETLSSRMAAVFYIALGVDYVLVKRLFKTLYKIRSSLVHERIVYDEDVQRSFRLISQCFSGLIHNHRQSVGLGTHFDDSVLFFLLPDCFGFDRLSEFMLSVLTFLRLSVSCFDVDSYSFYTQGKSYLRKLDSIARCFDSDRPAGFEFSFSPSLTSDLRTVFYNSFISLLKRPFSYTV